MILEETVEYYVNNNTPAFCTFLDVTKAFDEKRDCKLFKLLVERHLPASIVRAFLNFCTGNYVRVSWGGVFSPYFIALMTA